MLIYSARCSVAAVTGWHLSLRFGFGEPVWAAMSALIISQVGLHETRPAPVRLKTQPAAEPPSTTNLTAAI
jgi:hypothetical protein